MPSGQSVWHAKQELESNGSSTVATAMPPLPLFDGGRERAKMSRRAGERQESEASREYLLIPDNWRIQHYACLAEFGKLFGEANIKSQAHGFPRCQDASFRKSATSNDIQKIMTSLQSSSLSNCYSVQLKYFV